MDQAAHAAGPDPVEQLAAESATSPKGCRDALLTSRSNHWMPCLRSAYERRVLDGVMSGGMKTRPLGVGFGQQ